MSDKVQGKTDWPPALITSTKFPIQFYVDSIDNPDHQIPDEKRAKCPWAVLEGDQANGRLLYLAGGVSQKGPFVVDVGWPGKFRVQPDMSSIDEGACDLIYGIVRATRPSIVLETGTHKGRSTHAITSALCENEKGSIFTLDCVKWVDLNDILSPGECGRCTQLIGHSPQAFNIHPLAGLQGIDFAFLDGAHDGETLLKEIEYVDTHRADTCIVCVDNTMDAGWPEIRKVLDTLTHKGHVVLETMAGMDIITLRNVDPKVMEGATFHVDVGGAT